MRVLYSLSDIDPAQPSVVSIGNFDGLHLGHQAILKAVAARARELGIRAVAMTFSPHPVRFLAPAHAPRLISTLEQKIRLIEQFGIDLLFIADFDERFSRLSPDEFIRRYLINGLVARAVCVGSNFSFGYRQGGTVATLRKWTEQFEVIEVPPVRVRRAIVSSTRTRHLVAGGSVSLACRTLGRWFEIEGTIVKGAGRGRTETVPTLNLDTPNELIPKNGVYISRISLDGGPYLDSVTNIGVRPTFGENALTVETFVLRDAVRKNARAARLQFVRRMRDETRFESAEALRRQIGSDVRHAKRFFHLLQSLRHAGTHSH